MIDCSWIFRVLDVAEYDSSGQLFVGTGFLVSSKGYALTTWHNFDYDFQLGWFDDERELQNLRIAPRWGEATDKHNWARVRVVGRWSNPDQDFAVLKLSTQAIKQFRLQPAPLAVDISPGLKVAAIGFHRPAELDESDLARGYLLNRPDMIRTIHGNQRVIEIIYEDIPFEQGMSGGPIASDDLRFVIAMETASDLPPRDGSGYPIFARMLNKQEARGYATPISILLESWPQIEQYCKFVNIDKNPCCDLIQNLPSRLRTPLSVAAKEALLEACNLAQSMRHEYIYTPHLIYAMLSLDNPLSKQIKEIFDINTEKVYSRICERLHKETSQPQKQIEPSATLYQVLHKADKICQETNVFYINLVHLFQALCMAQAELGKDILEWVGIDEQILPHVLRPYLHNQGLLTPDMKGE